jgi:hypothetical protein
MASRVESNVPAVVSVTEMARMCRLSRSHFHALVRDGAMASPIYCIRSRRPCYPAELQAACLRVRETNVGYDGRLVIFYAPRGAAKGARQGREGAAAAQRRASPHAELLDGLRRLGLGPVGEGEVADALAAVYPNGTAGIEAGAVLRGVWKQLRRANGG